MLSFARATFLLGVQLLANVLPAARAAQYNYDEIEDIFDGLRNENCTGFDLCNPEWTEATFDGWQKHHLFILINCQMEMNYDILDHHTVEIVNNDLNDMGIFNTLDRIDLVYNALDFSDDVVEAGECGNDADASAPAPAESLDTICGSVGYYGKCHPDLTKSSVNEYTKFALKELIRCQVRRFEDILNEDDIDYAMTYLYVLDKDDLRRTVLKFNDIANAEYCTAHDASAPAPAENIVEICGSVGYYGKCHPDWNRSTLNEYTKFALKELIRCQVRRFEDILDDDDVDSVLAYLNNMNKDALERTALEFNKIANAEYCDGTGADAPVAAPGDDMPDNAPSSGYIYSSIGGVAVAAYGYAVGF